MPDTTIASTQTYTLTSTLTSGTNIDFVGLGGTLIIEPAAITTFGIGGTINNFDPGDHITISNLNSVISELGYPSDASYATALEGYGLTIATNGAVTSNDPLYNEVLGSSTKAQIQTIANEIEHGLFGPSSLTAPLTLSVIADPSGNFADAVLYSPFDINPCFAAGTRILLADGSEMPVEALAAGDEVALHGGATAPILWIGKRKILLKTHPNPDLVRPVLIKAQALGDGLPKRDLAVSPDHALFFNGHLIPAKVLLNGFSIRQTTPGEVTYYHIELARHAVLLAEGVGCESYLDTGNRAAFQNDGVVVMLHPQFAQGMREKNSCAPLVEAGPVVEAVRQQILGRAGIETTSDPAMEIRFEAGGAVILSRSAVPGELTADPRDRRRLGVKINRLQIGGREIALDHPALVEGWHELEADGRWTDGQAMIPAGLLGGAMAVEISLAAALSYPVGQAALAAQAGMEVG